MAVKLVDAADRPAGRTSRWSSGRSPGEDLRAACEVRDAALIAHGLRHALRLPVPPPWTGPRLRDLAAVVTERRWWRTVH